jgi:hypothetical protein
MDDMKRMEAGSGRDLADIEMPVFRLFEIEEDFGRHPHGGKVDHGFYKASAASLRKRLTPPCGRGIPLVVLPQYAAAR